MDNRVKNEIIEWIKYIGFAVILAMVIRSFVFMTVKVPTGSMYPTIMEGDVLIVNRLAYRFGTPERKDIIVFRYPDNPKEFYVKRLIGLGGERVDISDGKVYIDEKPIEEEYLAERMKGTFGPYDVPEQHFFMMGDNRNNSGDSRYWVNKYVSTQQIIGKAVFTIWPLNRIGPMK
jgi:signal peptidase I